MVHGSFGDNRSIGVTQRFRSWCHQNPAIAALMLCCLLLLVFPTIFTRIVVSRLSASRAEVRRLENRIRELERACAFRETHPEVPDGTAAPNDRRLEKPGVRRGFCLTRHHVPVWMPEWCKTGIEGTFLKNDSLIFGYPSQYQSRQTRWSRPRSAGVCAPTDGYPEIFALSKG
jgi:hypothetical protein